MARNTLIDRARASHPNEPQPDGEDEQVAPQDEAPPPGDALATCLERTMAELSADDVVAAGDLAGRTLRGFADDHGFGLAEASPRAET